MAVYRKNEQGQVKRVANSFIQRWNDKIFQTTHSTVIRNGQTADLYTLENSASKYIVDWTEYTEYQMYFDTPNLTKNVYISYKNTELKLTSSSDSDIQIGLIHGKINLYVLLKNNMIWVNDIFDTPNSYNKPEIDEKLEKLEVNGGYL